MKDVLEQEKRLFLKSVQEALEQFIEKMRQETAFESTDLDTNIQTLARAMGEREITMRMVQDRLIEAVLRECNGNMTQAAAVLGITTRTIRNFQDRKRGEK